MRSRRGEDSGSKESLQRVLVTQAENTKCQEPERMEESVYPKSCQRVTGERAWELKRGVTQIKDNMSLRGCTEKKNNVRSWSLCSKNCFSQREDEK